MCKAAGVRAVIEKQHIFEEDDAKPGDVFVDHGWVGRHGRAAMDVVVTDAMVGAHNEWELRKCEQIAGRRCNVAEDSKRKSRSGPLNQTMQKRLDTKGIQFIPLGFETSGGTGKSWSIFIKTICQLAHERQGHNVAHFRNYWTRRIGMTLAKVGAEIAINRLDSVRTSHSIHDIFRAPHTENPLFCE